MRLVLVHALNGRVEYSVVEESAWLPTQVHILESYTSQEDVQKLVSLGDLTLLAMDLGNCRRTGRVRGIADSFRIIKQAIHADHYFFYEDGVWKIDIEGKLVRSSFIARGWHDKEIR